MFEARANILSTELFVHSRTQFERPRLQLREIAPFIQLTALTAALALSRFSDPMTTALERINEDKVEEVVTTFDIPTKIPALLVDEKGESILELSEDPDVILKEMGLFQELP